MSAMLNSEDGPGRRHRVVIGSGVGGLTVEPGQATGHRRCLTIRRSWCGKAAFAFPNFGIEDRGDSGGVVSLVSKPEALSAQLRKYEQSTSNQTVTNAVRRALIHEGAHPHTVPAGT